MLRWTLPLVAAFAIGPAAAADGPVVTKRALTAPPANCRPACRARITNTGPP